MFTQTLLEYLPTPNVTLPDIMRDVREAVLSSTAGQQSIWVQARMMDDCVLSPYSQVRVRPSHPTSRRIWSSIALS